MSQSATVREGHARRGIVPALVLGCSALGMSVAAATLLVGGSSEATGGETLVAQSHEYLNAEAGDVLKLDPLPVHVRRAPTLRATFTTVPGNGEPDGGVAGGCPTEVKTYSGSDFTGGQYIMQAGFVATEIAAAEFVISPEDFPLKIDLAEMLFAQLNTNVGTVTHWSIMVWEGNPQTGALIEVFSSDDIILPHISLPPGTHVVNVQVLVDPSDPEQIIIHANPSNSFTIGFRIDKHNNPPTQSCPCPFIGTLPAVCCPPPTNSNTFPTTDATGMTNASKNWIWARNCPGVSNPLLCGVLDQGWHTFSDLGAGGPSGDWNIRVTYTPLSCEVTFGACCKPTGCEVQSNIECANQGGIYQGANTTCAGVTCPFGACCMPQGGCQSLTSSACAQQGGTYHGDGSSCAEANCPQVGACCFGGAEGLCFNSYLPADCERDGGVFVGGTCGGGGCSLLLGACCVPATGQCAQDVEEGTCNVVGGNWQGMGSNCANIICFPIGACCLPSGSCAGQVSPDECAEAGGTFQGHQSTCGSVTCPQPSGACCLSNGNCVVATSANCTVFAGQWMGGGTNCADNNGNGMADACEPPVPPCPGDLTGSGSVGVPDLLQLLSAWGPCTGPCPEDLTGSGSVGVPDLLQLLSAWGPCQ